MRILELYVAVLIVLLPTRWLMATTVGRVHGWLWALPMTLLGALRLILYRPQRIRWVDGVLEVDVKTIIPGWAMGQTVGMLSVFMDGELNAPLRAHEHRHAWQFAIYGPLMLLLYPLAGFFSWVGGGGFYRGNYFEQDARAHEGDPP